MSIEKIENPAISQWAIPAIGEAMAVWAVPGRHSGDMAEVAVSGQPILAATAGPRHVSP